MYSNSKTSAFGPTVLSMDVTIVADVCYTCCLNCGLPVVELSIVVLGVAVAVVNS